MRFVIYLVCGAASLLGACQPAGSSGSSPRAADTSAPSEVNAPAQARTEAEARAAVAFWVRQQPAATLYQLEDATALAVDDHWQVLVPRSDWADRLPNKAAFEVDKATGTVRPLAVK